MLSAKWQIEHALTTLPFCINRKAFYVGIYGVRNPTYPIWVAETIVNINKLGLRWVKLQQTLLSLAFGKGRKVLWEDALRVENFENVRFCLSCLTKIKITHLIFMIQGSSFGFSLIIMSFKNLKRQAEAEFKCSAWTWD